MDKKDLSQVLKQKKRDKERRLRETESKRAEAKKIEEKRDRLRQRFKKKPRIFAIFAKTRLKF